MRKLVYLAATSLDGMICRPDGSFDCFPMEGDHIDDYLEMLRTFGAVLMGRKTYEGGLKVGVTDPFPHLDSYVISTSMRESPNPRVTLVRNGAAEFVRNLKRQSGRDIYLCGGAQLAGSLFKAGLIDEIIVKLNPLVVGPGIPLFAGLDIPVPLRLAGSKVYNSGVVLLTYTPSLPTEEQNEAPRHTLRTSRMVRNPVRRTRSPRHPVRKDSRRSAHHRP